MNAVIAASGLGNAYRRTWALRDCTLAIPEGHVVGLVGPNGAGKTTLLRLATGMLTPTRGTITVLGERPAAGPAQLARVGFVAQDTAVYARLTVADHLRLGAWLNPGWDDDLAQQRIGQLALNPKQRAGSLSGGERAQLVLTLAMAKGPELLLLDEPVASLDPLARREFLQGLMEVRLRPRRHRRGADPAHHPGHGRHPGHLRRPPGRRAAVGPPQPRPARPHGQPGHLAGKRPGVARH